jgi:signal transduction histidine kinase
MLMPISSEFIALCRSQISLLTQVVGASISVVYINQELGEGTPAQLVPIAVYPDGYADLRELEVRLLSNSNLASSPVQSLLRGKMLPQSRQVGSNHLVKPPVESNPLHSEAPPPFQSIAEKSSLANQRQIVLPLMHEEMMLGLLVTQRDDRAWTAWEEAQAQEVATSIAIACVLDQRYQWMDRDRQQEHALRIQQHDMMDNLLHQFRNSLTALQTFGKLMIKRLLPGDQTRDIATNMVREATRLQELSQQLELVTGINPPRPLALPPTLDANPTLVEPLGDAVIEVQTVPLLPTAGFLAGTSLPLERCLVESVIEPLLASISTLAEGKGQTLHRQISEDLPPVWANLQALREVLHNLLENAVKYTPDQGHIFITVFANEPEAEAGVNFESHLSWLEIAITDTGFGIPPQDLPHLFERHYRGVQAEGSIPGSGLGLAIAKTLIEQMQGTIQAISPADLSKVDVARFASLFRDRIGTTFVVQLAIALNG